MEDNPKPFSLSIQLWIKKNYKEVLSLMVVGGVILLAIILKLLKEEPGPYIPPTPEEYQNAAQTPEWRCSCWDDVAGVCYPQKVCNHQAETAEKPY